MKKTLLRGGGVLVLGCVMALVIIERERRAEERQREEKRRSVERLAARLQSFEGADAARWQEFERNWRRLEERWPGFQRMMLRPGGFCPWRNSEA